MQVFRGTGEAKHDSPLLRIRNHTYIVKLEWLGRETSQAKHDNLLPRILSRRFGRKQG